MAIVIVEQTEKRGKEEYTTLCKQIRLIPTDNDGFMPLGFTLLQIIVKDTRTNVEYKIKWNDKAGMPGRINLHYPDTTEMPTFWVGTGKTRRKAHDYFAKPVVKKGKKFGYNDPKELVDDNQWLKSVIDQIATLFGQKIAETYRRAA